MSSDYIRICPTCASENAVDVMRCSCGTLLFGLDLVKKEEPASPLVEEVRSATPAAASVVCPYEDCGQANPPDSDTCLYCNRHLAHGQTIARAADSLISLPAALRERFRLVRAFPAQGSEADILLIASIADGTECVAKVYRQGIQPSVEVQQRVTGISPDFRVAVLESGNSQGHAYELMELCRFGSLRELLAQGPLETETVREIARQIAAAIAAVHAAGLVHRDLKPDNVLVRARQPLAVVLADFGIAAVLTMTQRFTGAARTLHYASPESLSGVIDGKVDYWALGMILLEASLGRHPFAGLSDAVILHQLTTRSINTSELADREIRKLVRGLLLRDPERRWGDQEIARWLAADPLLPEPMEEDPGARFVEPYHLAEERCASAEHLALALSRHWQLGLKDLLSGQLISWFRDIQKDQNTVRLMLEMQYDQRLAVDEQLLRLILHLAPGLPAVWRGEKVEIPDILARTNLALKGDADAARWIDELYQKKVLTRFGEAGHSELGQIDRRWRELVDAFDAGWNRQRAVLRDHTPARVPGEVVNFDDLVQNQFEDGPPALVAMHPRLIASLYDHSWSERLRTRLVAERVELVVHCDWLIALGDPAGMDAIGLMVFESLLPEARKLAQRQQKALDLARENAANEEQTLTRDVEEIVMRLRHARQRTLYLSENCDALRGDLQRYFELLTEVRASPRGDAQWLELRKLAVRPEPVAIRLRDLLDRLEARRIANSGWLDSRVLVALVGSVLFIPLMLRFSIFGVFLIGVLLVYLWRFLPNIFLVQRARELLAKL